MVWNKDNSKYSYSLEFDVHTFHLVLQHRDITGLDV